MSEYPPLTVFDQNEIPIGEASLEEIHAKGLRHRVVIIVVFDFEGRILLQKRSKHVATNVGKWDFSAAGHVDAGEDYRVAAERELQEELGISKTKLTEATHYYTESTVDGRKLNRFIKIFKARVAGDTSFKIERTEVSEIKWTAVTDLVAQLSARPQDFSHDFEELLNLIVIPDENLKH